MYLFRTTHYILPLLEYRALSPHYNLYGMYPTLHVSRLDIWTRVTAAMHFYHHSNQHVLDVRVFDWKSCVVQQSIFISSTLFEECLIIFSMEIYKKSSDGNRYLYLCFQTLI